MRISEICIQRPVFATVLSLVVMLLGLVSYERRDRRGGGAVLHFPG